MQDWQAILFIQAQALSVVAMGMVAENDICKLQGEPPKFTGREFDCVAQEIEGLAQGMRH